MQLRCLLCNRTYDIEDETVIAKRARQIPGFVFICRPCQLDNVKHYGRRRERPNPLLRNRNRPR